jgi:hypothetical protein
MRLRMLSWSVNRMSDFCLYNCLTGEHAVIAKTPFKIGSGEDSDLKLNDPDVAHEHCVIYKKDKKTFLVPNQQIGELILDGVGFGGGELDPGQDHTLCVGSNFFAIRGDTHPKKWLQSLDCNRWFIFDKSATSSQGPFHPADLSRQLSGLNGELEHLIVYCKGLTSMGFPAETILPHLAKQYPTASGAPEQGQRRNGGDQSAPSEEPVNAEVNLEYGEFTCPVCWLKFDRGDVMNIAVHGSLRGDPILGEEHMQRFHATRFNDKGQAIDAMNIPVSDMACPHCRRKLPPSFLDTPHYIFSIVGAPSSGKSYYLSVLVKTLQATLYKNFGISFRDSDPSENVILNHMKSQLFSAVTTEEAFLAKTELEGGMYETLPRLGRKVKLPKPFIFRLSSSRDHQQNFSVVFYDNAGEHFEPTRNSAESPGAQHIAAASGIFFLFDPLHNLEFRRKLEGGEDPQLHLNRVDQQDVILAETEVRVKNLLGMDTKQRISTPLAVIVGKCDTWIDLIGRDKIQNPIENGCLNLGKIEENSKLIRDFLLRICPAIVSNAESISSEVMYFAVSPLGCSPVEFTDSRGVKLIGPNPKNLNPMFVEVPTLWVLSRIEATLIPGFR